MPERLFRSLYKKCTSLPMAVFLSLVVVLCALGGTASVSAQSSNPQADLIKLNNTYVDFLNLFTTTTDGKVVSGIEKTGILTKTGNNDALGLTFQINLGIDTSKKDAEWHWDRASEQRDANYLILLCEKTKPDNCWINTIDSTVKKVTGKSIYQQDASGKYLDRLSISFSAFGTDVGTSFDTNNTGSEYRYTPSTKDITRIKGLILPKNSQLTGTLWYCAGKGDDPTKLGENSFAADDGQKAAIAYKAKGVSNEKVTQFTEDTSDIELCESTTYFRIGEPVDITIPADGAELTDQVAAGQASLKNPDNASAEGSNTNLPTCSIGITDSHIMGCIARGVYYAVYWPLAWVAGFFGKLFDFFLGYTLSDESYRFEFVTTAWKVIRDVSNIFFIIILVWTGFSTVFGISKVSMRQVIPTIIINALIINFSLFGTRLLVDMSNVVARVFYGQIHVCINTECTAVDGGSPYKTNGTGGYKPISEAIVASFNPQQIFSEKYIVPQNKVVEESKTSVDFNSTEKDKSMGKYAPITSDAYAGYFIVVCLFAAAIMFFVMKMFWTMALMFLGRVVGIYISMIFSPFAFLSRGNVPLIGKVGFLGWDDWLKDISAYAMQAPIFVFFLYVIYSFMQKQGQFVSESILNQGADSGLLEGVLSVTIPMGIIYFFISYGVNISKKYSGKVGEMIQSTVDGFVGGAGGIVGVGAGLATGGAALLGRNVIGRAGVQIAESQKLQDAASSGKWYSGLANRALGAGSTLSSATYDVRNTSLGKNIEKQTGNMNNSFVKKFGLGTNKTEGGFRAAVTRNEKVLTEKANRFQVTGAKAARIDAASSAWEKTYDTAREAAELAAFQAGTVFDESQFRTTYEVQQQNAGKPRIKSAAETNKDRETAYQTSLSRGTFLSRIAKRSTSRITTPVAGMGAAGLATGTMATASAVAVVGSAVVGQGAIQGDSRENFINNRASKARKFTPAQRAAAVARIDNKIQKLNTNKLRIYKALEPVINTGVLLDDLTVADITQYINNNPNTLNLGSSPKQLLDERNRINTELKALRKEKLE